MEYTIDVENIKCGGCANTIRKRLVETHGLKQVEVDIEHGRITAASAVEGQQDAIAETLLSLGYPKQGSTEGLGHVKAKAVSFVSCAIGRMDS